MITQERLKELFWYNPEDGNLYNNFDINPRAKRGSISGCVKLAFKGSDYYRRVIKVDNSSHLAHRLVWVYHKGAIDESLYIDHIDGNPLNNKIENLRLITLSENQRNRKRCKGNTTGVVGVIYLKSRGNYRAQIVVNSVQKILGCFKDFEDAVKARKEAEKLYNFHPNHGREPVQLDVQLAG